MGKSNDRLEGGTETLTAEVYWKPNFLVTDCLFRYANARGI
jgi:hypothetical protein